jgi:LPXTG-motif cell wall-anchored protein
MNPNADVEMYWIAAIASALLGIGLLLTAAVMAVRRRRVPLA